MEQIKGFILSLCAASAASALVDGILPDGSVKKYAGYLLSLVVLLVILSPIKGIVGAIPSLTANVYSYDSVQVLSRANGIVAMHIEKALCGKFALDDSEVECGYNGEIITVRVKKHFGLLPEDIESYILNRFGVASEVTSFE